MAWDIFDFVEDPHPSSQGIDLDLLSSASAAQEFLPLPLESELADFVSHAVALCLLGLELFGTDFSQVTEEMGTHAVHQVTASWPDAQRDAG